MKLVFVKLRDSSTQVYTVDQAIPIDGAVRLEWKDGDLDLELIVPGTLVYEMDIVK